MSTTRRLTMLLLPLLALAAGCAQPRSADSEPRYTPKMRTVIESSCEKRFTGTEDDCRKFATCVMDRNPVKRFEAFMEETQDGETGPASERYLTSIETCGEDVGIDIDPAYRDSPEFIARHEDAYRAQMTKLLRDDVCMPERARTKGECQAWAECMLEELGVQKVYDSAMDSMQTGTIEPEVDAAWTRCERDAG